MKSATTETFRQIDPKWKDLLRHAGGIADALSELDRSVADFYWKRGAANEGLVWSSFASLSEELHRFMNDEPPIRHADFIEHDYGCWDMCIATIARRLGASFYCHDRRSPLSPDPKNLLRAMQSWQIVSLTGYADNLYTDPVSVITRGELQLIAKEDYGQRGVPVAKSPLLATALLHAERCGIVINVEGHEAFGSGDDCHWIVVEPPIPGKDLDLVDNVGDGDRYPTETIVHDIAVYARRSALSLELKPAKANFETS